MQQRNNKMQSANKQHSITVTMLQLLKKPYEHVGKQIKVPGAFWQSRMSEAERSVTYLCTICEFELIHKFEEGQAQ
jgi:hypothetical protein